MRVVFQLTDLWGTHSNHNCYRHQHIQNSLIHKIGQNLGQQPRFSQTNHVLMVLAVIVPVSSSTQRSVFSLEICLKLCSQETDYLTFKVSCKWDVRGMCMRCAWDVHGIYIECAWDMHGMYLGAIHSNLIYLVCERSRKRWISGTG